MSVNWCWLQNFIFFFFPFLLTAHCLFCCKQSLKKIKPSVGSLFKSVAIFSTSLPHENVFHRHKQSRLNPQLVPFSNPSHPQTANIHLFVPDICADEVEDLAIARIVCLLLLYLWEGKSKSADASSSCYRIVLALGGDLKASTRWGEPWAAEVFSSWKSLRTDLPTLSSGSQSCTAHLHSQSSFGFQGHPATATAVCELGWAPAF